MGRYENGNQSASHELILPEYALEEVAGPRFSCCRAWPVSKSLSGMRLPWVEGSSLQQGLALARCVGKLQLVPPATFTIIELARTFGPGAAADERECSLVGASQCRGFAAHD